MYHGCMRYELERRGIPEFGNPAILFILRRQVDGRPVTQREIADRLGVAPPTVAVAVKRMERAGLLRKKADETDLRKNWITLTDKGKSFTDSCQAAEGELYRQIMEGFTQEEAEALHGFYLRMMSNMQSLGCRWPKFLEMIPGEEMVREEGSAGTD